MENMLEANRFAFVEVNGAIVDTKQPAGMKIEFLSELSEFNIVM